MRLVTLSTVIFAVLLVGDALPASQESYKRFDGHKVYRAITKTKEQLDLLRNIEEQAEDGILFWSSASALNSGIDVMVSPEKEAEIRSTFQRFDISHKILIEDVQTLIENENPEIGRSMQQYNSVTSLNWTAYHRLDAIYDWLDELVETYPDLVKPIEIGYSYEGRLIKGIKITFAESNPGIFIEGGLHAREWISPAVVTYLTSEILTSKDPAFSQLVRAHNWFIIPSTNPDGYEYSHTKDRMWRKTRVPYANGCYGADPNRNWDYFWLSGGASNDSCSETYAGPKPFSEVEVSALAGYIASVSDQFYIYLSIHSYSQLILMPYGYTSDRLDNYNDTMYIAAKAAKALAKRYGTEFRFGSTAEAIYVASGISTDYVKGLHKTPIVYCYELRDTGYYGFILPAEQIIPSALEFIDSLQALIREARGLGYPKIHTRDELEV